MKYDLVAIIFPHNFYLRASGLAFREEFPIVRKRRVVFIQSLGVQRNDLCIDGIDLLTMSLALASLT